MDMQKEREEFSNWFGASFTNGKIEFDADGVPLGYEKAIAWRAWQAAKASAQTKITDLEKHNYSLQTKMHELNSLVAVTKASAVPKNPWVYFDKPELNQDEDSDCLTSKEVFFEVSHLCGIYHGWYMARPVDKSDQYFYEEELENDDVEYEYFFNANVGDELFDEDSIARWMYVPEAQEQP